MKTIAFFNNKGGVGKTSLVYHLAWMLQRLGYRVLAVDLDPQANLSAMFLDEDTLWRILENKRERSIYGAISPLFRGVGDIAVNPHIEIRSEGLGLLVGDLGLAEVEDELSGTWPRCLSGEERAFRVITAFARLTANASRDFKADVVLVDLGPNLGSINRAALVGCDHVIIPLAPDLYSMQGLRNMGPKVRQWQEDWEIRKLMATRSPIDVELPEGGMAPLGYVAVKFSVLNQRPAKAFQYWLDEMPGQYRTWIVKNDTEAEPSIDEDPYCLAQIRDYKSLIPKSQTHYMPIFDLGRPHGVFGASADAAERCAEDFEQLAIRIVDRAEFARPPAPVRLERSSAPPSLSARLNRLEKLVSKAS
ncbi:MAG: AAA family ATPase [Hyphomicrobiales bacterium]|nr:AAA family ATPase [Hyphomicrobiales bacterium]